MKSANLRSEGGGGYSTNTQINSKRPYWESFFRRASSSGWPLCQEYIPLLESSMHPSMDRCRDVVPSMLVNPRPWDILFKVFIMVELLRLQFFSGFTIPCPCPSSLSNSPPMEYMEEMQWEVLTLCFVSCFTEHLVRTVFLVAPACLAWIAVIALIIR